ncbi:MAG: hypothetical protein IPK60_23050 [Sandaracinaceae bacterium]|jgi:hypothetical protein|nr:hypothetical protein [Sandaracinaceae bacterium]
MVTKARPQTCPWRAYEQPIVADVLSIRAKQRAKTLTAKTDLPQRTLDAVTAFETALSACRHEIAERDRKQREAEERKTKGQKR